jgi:hypothetical protein
MDGMVSGALIKPRPLLFFDFDFQNFPEACVESPVSAWRAAKSTNNPMCGMVLEGCNCTGGDAAWCLEKVVTSLIPAWAFCFFCLPFDLSRVGLCTEYLLSSFRVLALFINLELAAAAELSGGLGHCVVRSGFAALTELKESVSSSSHHSSSLFSPSKTVSNGLWGGFVEGPSSEVLGAGRWPVVVAILI